MVDPFVDPSGCAEVRAGDDGLVHLRLLDGDGEVVAMIRLSFISAAQLSTVMVRTALRMQASASKAGAPAARGPSDVVH
jgi:predicted GNAT family N-acyltransferase